MTFDDAVIFCMTDFFARWLNQQVGRKFGGEGYPTLYNHPAIKVLVAYVQRDPDYALRLAAHAARCAKTGEFDCAVVAFSAIVHKFGPRDLFNKMDEQPRNRALAWLARKFPADPPQNDDYDHAS